MVRKILLFLLFSSMADAGSVYPPSANELRSLELGEAILFFMPKEDAEIIAWDYHVDGPIAWLTDGFEPYPSNRRGFFREGRLKLEVQHPNLRGRVST
jgi:hypothetical protein